MKNRIIRVLLLLTATALISIPCVASDGRQDDIEQTDVAAQEEISTEIEEKVNIKNEKEWIEGWTTNVVNVREEPYEGSRILKVLEDCSPIYFYKYNDKWIAIETTDGSCSVAYIKSEYITINSTENEYRQLMKERLKEKDKKEWFLKYKEFIGVEGSPLSSSVI